MIVKNININNFTAVLAKDILSSFELLDSDYISNNKYTSSKLTLDELYKKFHTDFSIEDKVLSGQWTFKSTPKTTNPTEDCHAINLSYLSSMFMNCKSIYNDLINNIFINGKTASYKGMIIASSLSSESQIKELYTGRSWKQIANGKFIVGARPTDKYGIPNDDGIDTVYLTDQQCVLNSHTHDFKGGSFGGNKKVDMGNRIEPDIKVTAHSKAGASRACYSSPLLAAYCQGYFRHTSETYNFGGKSSDSNKLEKAPAPFSNKPAYMPVYFWERTS